MAGLDPAIHAASLTTRCNACGMDPAIKCRGDDQERQSIDHRHPTPERSTPMTLASTPGAVSSAQRLAASRSAALCGTEGLDAVFRRAVAAGEANG